MNRPIPVVQPADSRTRDSAVLIVAIFIAGLCSIIYELLIGSVSSYFLGDSIKQFSLTIGLYMAAMGAGAFFSRLVRDEVLPVFIYLEILLGFLGGASVPLLYACYSIAPDQYTLAMIALILAIGLLIGFEIPLLTRLLEKYYTLKVNISNVLGIDYLGALTATMLFPFVLLPFVGTFRSSLLFGLVNMGIAVIMLIHFGTGMPKAQRGSQWFFTITSLTLLLGGFIFAPTLTRVWSQSLYDDRILLEKQTPYQKLVLTRYRGDIRLFIDGSLQFSSRDEYRYHEPLVQVTLATLERPEQVLVLGGGDGMAVREILKHPTVRSVVLVDLDPAMTELARENPLLRSLSSNSLNDQRVAIINRDAMQYLANSEQLFDCIIADLPDPDNPTLSRLYSREFYNLVRLHLREGGVFSTQSTSPFYANKAFWCIHETLKEAGFGSVYPYHAYVPSFGDWGFNLATDHELNLEQLSIKVPTRFLRDDIIGTLFEFAADIDLPDKPLKVNSIDRPALLDYYVDSWRYWR